MRRKYPAMMKRHPRTPRLEPPGLVLIYVKIESTEIAYPWGIYIKYIMNTVGHS